MAGKRRYVSVALTAGLVGMAALPAAASAASKTTTKVDAPKISVIAVPGAKAGETLSLAAAPAGGAAELALLSKSVNASDPNPAATTASLATLPLVGKGKALATGGAIVIAPYETGQLLHSGTLDWVWNGSGLDAISATGAVTVANTAVAGGVGFTTGPSGKLWLTEDGGGTTGCTAAVVSLCKYTAFPQTLMQYEGAGGPDALASAAGKLWEVTQSGVLFSMTTTGRYAGPYLNSGGDAGPLAGDPGNAIVSNGKDLYAAAAATAPAASATAIAPNTQIDRIDPAHPGAQPKVYAAAAKMPVKADINSLALGPDGNIWFEDGGTGAIGRLDLKSGKVSEYTLPKGYRLELSGLESNGIATGPAGTRTLFFPVKDRAGKPAAAELTIPVASTGKKKK